MLPIADKHVLSNGMEVLTVAQPSSPLVSFWLWYKVGSRHELPGATGLSHWVEHMMFKGTPTFPGGTLDKLINESGGHWNAFTTPDCTAYYATLPVDRLETLLRIESDRMKNTVFTAASINSERNVILSERSGYENYPDYWLEEAVESTAFLVHPYRQSVLGSRTDLEHITPAELRRHYRRHYNPANALAVAVGGFEISVLLTLLEKYFGYVAPGKPSDTVHLAEPPQMGERIVTVRRPGPTSYLRIAYHVPAAGHPDQVALTLLDAILTGGKAPSAWSPDKELGRSSRLYRLLVDGGLASEVSTELHPTIDPGLFFVDVTIRPDADPKHVEDVTIRAVEDLATAPLEPGELQRAIKQCKAQLAYASEGVENLALLLGAYAVCNQVDYLYNLERAWDSCSEEDIHQAAAHYLCAKNRTVGRFLPDPTADAGADGANTTADAPSTTGITGDAAQGDSAEIEPQKPPTADKAVNDTISRTDERKLQAARKAAGLASLPPLTLQKPLPGPKHIQRTELAAGIACLACKSPGSIVTFIAAAPAGIAHEAAHEAGLARLTNEALLRGTLQHNAAELHTMADAAGMSISVSCEDEQAVLEISCLAEDAQLAAELLAEIWLAPAFPADEIVQVKGQQLTRIQEREDDTRAVADRVWRELAYSGHPFAHPEDGYRESVEPLTAEQCRVFHQQHYLQTPLTLCIAGAIEPQRAIDLLGTAWQTTGQNSNFINLARRLGEPIPAPALPPGIRRHIEMPGKSQSDIVIGLPTLPRNADDYPAFYLGHLILGRLGLYGRLGAHVRERLGLAYYVYAGLEPRTVASPWAVRAGVDPGCASQAVEAILHEISTISKSPVRPTELAEAIGYLVGTLPTVMESSAELCDQLLDIEHYQLGLDYLQVYPAQIAAVHASDIQAALAGYLDPQHFVQVIAGA